jgi:hypothetical protein
MTNLASATQVCASIRLVPLRELSMGKACNHLRMRIDSARKHAGIDLDQEFSPKFR